MNESEEYFRNIEIEMRKKKVIYDQEIVDWLLGIRGWITILVLGNVSMFVYSFLVKNIGYTFLSIACGFLGVWVVVLINKGIVAKKENILNLEDDIKEIENAQ